MSKIYKYNPILTEVNNGQFYEVTYNLWNSPEPTETVIFRTYNEAKSFFTSIPLS